MLQRQVFIINVAETCKYGGRGADVKYKLFFFFRFIAKKVCTGCPRTNDKIENCAFLGYYAASSGSYH